MKLKYFKILRCKIPCKQKAFFFFFFLKSELNQCSLKEASKYDYMRLRT